MRSIIVVIAALAIASTASAAGPARGPYHRDSHGKCRAAGGQIVVARLCHASVRPVCKPHSKPCGDSCIPADKTCHLDR
jgi:hypothetical protein